LSLRPVAAKGDCAEGTIFRAPTWSCHFNQASSTLIKSFELSFDAFASFRIASWIFGKARFARTLQRRGL
ncbi:MAG: hypothetical protein VXZ49_00395, partial [Planctomycetota bacterium]|nr:hypothetical protein [Planctomycetota bacterium]